MAFTAEARERYRQRYEIGKFHSTGATSVTVPENIVRLTEHEPCFLCGNARGPCRHREAA